MNHSVGTMSENEDLRNIAKIMKAMGYKMNHSSVRNYIIAIMGKFVNAYAKYHNNKSLSEKDRERIAKSPEFQNFVAEQLHVIEHERKMNRY